MKEKSTKTEEMKAKALKASSEKKKELKLAPPPMTIEEGEKIANITADKVNVLKSSSKKNQPPVSKSKGKPLSKSKDKNLPSKQKENNSRATSKSKPKVPIASQNRGQSKKKELTKRATSKTEAKKAVPRPMSKAKGSKRKRTVISSKKSKAN